MELSFDLVLEKSFCGTFDNESNVCLYFDKSIDLRQFTVRSKKCILME